MSYKLTLAFSQKASLIGYHLADNALRPEDEVVALRQVMSQFSTAVDQARRVGRSTPGIGGSLEDLD
jgi:hypothetical protein